MGNRAGIAGRSDDEVGAVAAEFGAHLAIDIGVDAEERGGQRGGHGQGGKGQQQAAAAEAEGGGDEA